MDGKQLLKFGLFRENDLMFDNSEITCVFGVKGAELIATTLAQIVHFEKRHVITREHLQFTTAIYVRKYNIVIAVTVKACQLYIFSLRAFGRPIVAGFDTGQQSVNRLVFSNKSDSLITFGERVKIWKLKVETPMGTSDVILPTITITKRAVLRGKFPIIGFSEVGFDSTHELVFLPTPEGIRPFTLDGEANPVTSKVPANPATVYHYREGTEQLITEDPSLGVCLWHRLGTLVKRLDFNGKPVMYFAFIDDENVVIMDSDATFFIMNVLTGRNHVCFTAPTFPTGVHLCGEGEEQRLVLVSHNLIYTYKVSIMWRVWALNVAKPRRITRMEKPGEAARLFVEDENWAAKLFSPKNGVMLTEATPRDAVKPVCYYYDRGYLENQHWDEEEKRFIHSFVKVRGETEKVVMTLNNGEVRVFDCISNPANEIDRPPAKGSTFTLCCSDGQWMYAMFATSGDLSLYSYTNFELLKRVSLSYEQAVTMHYFQSLGVLAVQYPKEIALVDPERLVLMDKMPFPDATVVTYYGEIVFVGCESGVVSRVDIIQNSFNRKCRQVHSHKTDITAISVSPTIWVSASSDGVVVVWNHDDTKLCKILCPVPIYACAVLNGKRDVLVATSTEIMIVDGVRMFTTLDEEDEQLDNFDRRRDPLDTVSALREARAMAPKADEAVPKKRPRYRISAKLREMIEQQRQALTAVKNEPEKPEAVPKQKAVVDAQKKQKVIDEMRALTDSMPDQKPEKKRPRTATVSSPMKSPARTPAKSGTDRVNIEVPEDPGVEEVPVEEAPKDEGNKALNFVRKSLNQERRAEARRSRRRQREKEKEVVEPPMPEPEVVRVKPRHRFNLTCPLPEPEEISIDFSPETPVQLDPEVLKQLERRKNRSKKLAMTQPLFTTKTSDPIPETVTVEEVPQEPVSEERPVNVAVTKKNARMMKTAPVPPTPELFKTKKEKKKKEKKQFPRQPTPPAISVRKLLPVVAIPKRSHSVVTSARIGEGRKRVAAVDEEFVRQCFTRKVKPPKATKEKRHGKKRPPALSIARSVSIDRGSAPDTASPKNPSPIPFTSIVNSKSTTFVPRAPLPRASVPKAESGKILEVRSIGRLVESQNVSTLAQDIRKMYEEEDSTESGTFVVTEPERIQIQAEQDPPPSKFYDTTDIFPQIKPREPPPKDPTIEILRALQRIERNLRPEEEDYSKWRGVPAKLPKMEVHNIDESADAEIQSTLSGESERSRRTFVFEPNKKHAKTHAPNARVTVRRKERSQDNQRVWRAQKAKTGVVRMKAKF